MSNNAKEHCLTTQTTAETERKDVCPVVTWYNEKHFYMERILSLVI